MVEVQSEQQRTLIVLSPNKSMSWETNKKILWAMFAVNLAIGLSFAYLGAWMILPFAGLEVGLVALGTYYVCWKLNFKEIIQFDAESVTLQKGVYYPKQSWQWQKSELMLIKQANKYRMSAPTLYLKHLNQAIEIGEFLNRSEKIELRNSLTKLGIPLVSRPSN